MFSNSLSHLNDDVSWDDDIYLVNIIYIFDVSYVGLDEGVRPEYGLTNVEVLKDISDLF